jgi:two-component system response regulator LytT
LLVFSNCKYFEWVFLDIQLSDGLSFEIFEKVEIKSAVIYITAYDEYAFRACKLNSIDYILKPIDGDDLEVAVQKFQSRIPQKESPKMNFEEIRKMLFNAFEKNHKKRFTVRIGQHLKVILVEEIECVYSENKDTYIHTFDNRNYLLESSLELLEQDLDQKEFYRISRKFIIPLQAIKEIVIYSNSRLKVVLPSYTTDDVVVSWKKVYDFKNWIG